MVFHDYPMLDEVLRRARFRLLADRWLAASAAGLALFLTIFVVQLVLGTAIVTWWIPVAAGLALFLLFLGRSFWRQPSDLQIALLLDERCALPDELGTAFHFRDSASAIAAAQRRRTEAAVRGLDLARVIPFALPKSIYPVAGFGVLALFLLFLRFGVEHRLDLRQPIAQFRLDPFGLAARTDEKLEAEKRVEKQKRNELVSRLGTSTPDSPKEERLDTPPGTTLAGSGADPKEANGENPLGAGQKLDGKMDGSSGKPADESDASSGAPKQGAEQTPSSQEGAQQGAQAGGKSKGASEGSGMLSKLRDAVASLMSKMQPQASQSAGKQQDPKGAQTGQQSGPKQGQKAEAGSQPEGGGNEAAADDEQSAPGKGAGESKNQNASAKPGSGMGHQDGSKELQDVQQQAAMGKLSEIIGKRSANVTGEMTIESQSGPQQLKTGYTASTAKHGKTGGDVDRDEVPVEMQSYVQRYFQQVRQQAAAKAAKAGSPAPSTEAQP